jgi:zinc transporter ZupT
MAGFVAMISVFAVVCVEMFFAMKGAGHVHGNEYDNLIGEIGRDSMSDFGPEGTSYSRLEANEAPDNICLDNIDNNRADAAARPSGSSHGSDQLHLTGTLSDKEHNDGETDDDTPANGSTSRPSHPQPRRPRLSGNYRHQTHSELPIQNPQRQLLQCLLLEAGILFHSIFIGMALSVATGTSFIVLLVAIGFHQTFEGFALGSRIASLIPDLFAPSSMKPWLMSLAYGTTTPLGQAIGLVLHNLYDPASTAGLLMVGITNAISSGLLLFAGLVELLAEDFLSESSYETLKGRRRIEACVSVACGAILMAFVGAFA